MSLAGIIAYCHISPSPRLINARPLAADKRAAEQLSSNVGEEKKGQANASFTVSTQA